MEEVLSQDVGNEPISDGISISFSEDDMEAYLCLASSEGGYALSLLKARLKDAGIKTGIREDVLREISEGRHDNETVKVAEGIRPVHGKDGWFEYMFQTERSDKPKILKDGSVDYSRYGDIPSVEEGTVVALYHPASESKDGVSVLGELVSASKGKNMPRLMGRGFTVLEDGCTYVAKYGGKIVYEDGRIIITAELVISEDVSKSSGDIQYRHDIHIQGNVQAGMEVVSEKGNIIVDGYVESAKLFAGRDVVLKNGMQGNGRGTIVAGGDVSGKFFEQCTIDAGGDVNANAIMNSMISAKQDIIVSGKFGIIVGGSITAQRRIEATIIGNTAEVENHISAGIAGDLLAMLHQCEQKKNQYEREQAKVVLALEKIDEVIQKTGSDDLRQKKILLMRSKIEHDSAISEYQKKYEELSVQMEKASQAKVTISKFVYPGTEITINGVKTRVKEVQNHVEFARRGQGIIVYHLDEA